MLCKMTKQMRLTQCTGTMYNIRQSRIVKNRLQHVDISR